MQAEPTYRIRNWLEYNRVLIQRGSISIWIDEKAVPSLLPALIGITMRYLKTRSTNYGRNPMMYTRCEEAIGSYQTVVGWAGASGLGVYADFFDCNHVGLAGVRRR